MILFALRESVSETTGVAPYTLVYGRLHVGPLAVLKNMWINESDFPAPKTKSTAEFLKDLRDKLEIASKPHHPSSTPIDLILHFLR